MSDIEKEVKDIKIILVGESHIGKTCLIDAYFEQEFKINQMPTLSKSEFKKYLKINENKYYYINIWDTMGQEKYRSLTRSFLVNSNIVIFVYDITNRASFLELDFWINTVNEVLDRDKLVFGIVANKIDLFVDSKVKDKEGEEEAQKIGASFVQVSAKESPWLFIDFVNELIKQFISKENIKIEKFEFIDSKEMPKKKKENEVPKKKCC